MEFVSGLLSQAQPKQQLASETIIKLCDRLLHSTLLEDRRAAVLGLKGFSRDYREQVVTGGLRGLIAELKRDRQDVETVKATLETILVLFMREHDHIEEMDYISLWVTDELTQKEDNLGVLIELLDSHDFYVKLYTLQILQALLVNRKTKAQECILHTAFGISRLVSSLDDRREAIRDQSVVVLSHLADGNHDVQKLVAFENTFDKLLTIVEQEQDEEQGIIGGVIVEDALRLIANLLRQNVSNQNMFRETSCIPRLSNLLIEAEEWDIQSTRAIKVTLEICRLFVVPDASGTKDNQNALFGAGVLMQVLKLAFSEISTSTVRAGALETAGDLIRGNHAIQEKFASIDVPDISISYPNDMKNDQDENLLPVIQALLNWALREGSIHIFDLRAGAYQCLEAYLYKNTDTKSELLKQSIDGFYASRMNDLQVLENGENILRATLDYRTDNRTDPYKVWFASALILDIIDGGGELKNKLQSVVLGEEDKGEEVITALQSILSNLVSAFENQRDARIIVAYAMLLSVWLFEDLQAVNDVLEEGSAIQSLITNVARPLTNHPLVIGTCTALLGIIYDFTSKDSPISRSSLHQLLVNRIGRDQYVFAVQALREHPCLRDFNESTNFSAEIEKETGLPNVYFDELYVDFFKECFPRIIGAFDRKAEQEPLILGAHTKTEASIQAVEALELKLNQVQEQLDKALAQLSDSHNQHSQYSEEASTKIERLEKTVESLREELDESKSAAHSLQTEYDHVKRELLQIKNRSEELHKKVNELESIRAHLIEENTNLERERDNVRFESEKQLSAWTKKYSETDQNYSNSLKDLATVKKIREETDKRLMTVTGENKELNKVYRNLQDQFTKVKQQFGQVEDQLKAVNSERQELVHQLEQERQQRESAQGEISLLKIELGRGKKVRESLQDKIQNFEDQQSQGKQELEKLSAESEGQIKQYKDKIETMESEFEKKVEQIQQEKSSALQEKDQQLLTRVKEHKVQLEEINKRHEQQLEQQKQQLKEVHVKDMVEKLGAAKEAHREEIDSLKANGMPNGTDNKNDKTNQLQSELDDLLLVLSDLEDKHRSDKEKLKSLGQEVSDDDE